MGLEIFLSLFFLLLMGLGRLFKRREGEKTPLSAPPEAEDFYDSPRDTIDPIRPSSDIPKILTHETILKSAAPAKKKKKFYTSKRQLFLSHEIFKRPYLDL